MWNCWPLQFRFNGKEEREIVHAKRPKKTLYRDFWFWFFDKWTYTEQKTNATNCERKPTGKMWKMSPATRLNLSWQNNRVPSIYQSIKSDLFNCSFWSPTLYRMSCLSCLTTFHTHIYTMNTLNTLTHRSPKLITTAIHISKESMHGIAASCHRNLQWRV